MFLHFWFITCCVHPFSYRTSLFTKRPYASLCSNMLTLESVFEYICRKLTHLKISSRDEVFTRLFFFFSSWDEFLSVFLTGMSSSQDEISSRRKRVNSKRHFTIDRDNFSRDEFHLWTPSEWWSYKNQLLSFISIMESQSCKTFIT